MGLIKFTISGAHDVLAITSPQKNDLCIEDLCKFAKLLDNQVGYHLEKTRILF